MYQRWVLAGLFAAALLYAVGPRLVEFATRVQNYPRVLRQVVELRDRVEELEAEQEASAKFAAAQFQAGLVEGLARARGSILAMLSGRPPPELKAIGEREGTLVLIGEFADEPPPVQSRYAVQDLYTGVKKGVVEVIAVEEDRRLVFLTCVETTAPAFWRHLEERAPADAALPDNVLLTEVDFSGNPVVAQAEQTSPEPKGTENGD